MTLEEKEQVLAQFHQDFNLCKDYIVTVKNEIRSQDISNYPIFIASQELPKIGKVIIPKEELELQWNFAASHLEDFVNREIVQLENVEQFQMLYKEHETDICLLVVLDNEFNFVFLPA